MPAAAPTHSESEAIDPNLKQKRTYINTIRTPVGVALPAAIVDTQVGSATAMTAPGIDGVKSMLWPVDLISI